MAILFIFGSERQGMMMLVSYDVAKDDGGEKRLRRISKVLENYGQRVQYSVFECLVDPSQWVELKKKLIKEMNPEFDSLRFYSLGANWQRKVEHIGQKGQRLFVFNALQGIRRHRLVDKFRHRLG